MQGETILFWMPSCVCGLAIGAGEVLHVGVSTYKNHVSFDTVIARSSQLLSLYIFLSSTLRLGERDICLQSHRGNNAMWFVFHHLFPPASLLNMFMTFVIIWYYLFVYLFFLFVCLPSPSATSVGKNSIYSPEPRPWHILLIKKFCRHLLNEWICRFVPLCEIE